MHSHAEELRRTSLYRFAPPYAELAACQTPSNGRLEELRGHAAVWRLSDSETVGQEFELLRQRPRFLPLLVILPPPHQFGQIASLFLSLPLLHPKAVLRVEQAETVEALCEALAARPESFPVRVYEYLNREGVLRTEAVRTEVLRLFEMAPQVKSISAAAQRLYLSRRTLARHFAVAGLPPASQVLLFARLLHVAVDLQAGHLTVARAAAKYRFPDPFSLSNQMKRVLDIRPTEARTYLGWEWIVETWLERAFPTPDRSS